MPQSRAAKVFEAQLLAAAAKLHKLPDEPALRPIAALAMLIEWQRGRDERRAKIAQSLLRDLHEVHEWVRLRDDNWSNPKKPRRVVKFTREYLPEGRFATELLDLAEQVWPVLPFISFLWTARGPAWTPGEKTARLYEVIFVLLCTSPRIMRVPLYEFAIDVLRPMAARYPGLAVDEAADAVVEGLARRAAPVARYRPSAASIPQAATAVRVYMAAAIKRRFNDVVRKLVSQEVEVVPASTARRWRKMLGRTVEAAEAAAVRAQQRARQRRLPPDRYSVRAIARATARSRATVTKVLRELEERTQVVFGRTLDGAYALTAAEAESVVRELRKRGRRRPAGRGRV